MFNMKKILSLSIICTIAISTLAQLNPYRPMLQIYRPTLQNSYSPAVQNSNRPAVQNIYRPEVQNSYRPEVQNIYRPEVQNFYRPAVQNSNRPEVQNSYRPAVQNFDRPAVQNFDRPAVQNSYRPAVQNSNRPEVQNSNRPGAFVPLITERIDTDNETGDGDSYDKYINSLLTSDVWPPANQNTNKINDNINRVQSSADDDDESPVVSKPVRFVGVGTTDVEQLNNVTYALTHFGIILMRSVHELSTGNIIVSPTSIAVVLALLQQGTMGEAQHQMTRSLLMTPNVTAPTYQRLTYDMKKRNSRNILTVSNNLYLGEGFELEPEFKDTAVQYFGSEITNVDFSKPVLAVRQINKWISIQTHNRIAEFLRDDAVDYSTQLLIANAVYFKGLWETKFNTESTKPLLFHLSNGQSTVVPFMRMRHSFRYGLDKESNSFVAVLPFERYQYSLILLLPHEQSNVDKILNTLTNDKLVNYLKMDEVEIQLEIPKFTIKSHTNMIPVLQKMGVTDIFSPQVDLSRIGTYRTYSPRISTVIHTGYLSVDEQGLSASAVSGFAAIALSYEEPPAVFQANRPFLAVLWDTQFAIPLFIARIEDPSK